MAADVSSELNLQFKGGESRAVSMNMVGIRGVVEAAYRPLLGSDNLVDIRNAARVINHQLDMARWAQGVVGGEAGLMFMANKTVDPSMGGGSRLPDINVETIMRQAAGLQGEIVKQAKGMTATEFEEALLGSPNEPSWLVVAPMEDRFQHPTLMWKPEGSFESPGPLAYKVALARLLTTAVELGRKDGRARLSIGDFQSGLRLASGAVDEAVVSFDDLGTGLYQRAGALGGSL